jgi:hypothetical protein
MGFQIEDGIGSGTRVGVTPENQLQTQAETHQLQHHISRTKGQVYQTIGRETAITNTTQTILHMKNTSTSKLLAVTFIRVQLIGETGGTAVPAAETYFQIGFNRTYSSGGTAVTPVNVNTTSGNVAAITAYDNSPTMAGTFLEADAYYPDGSAMQIFNKQGSIILGFNDTIEVRLITDHTAGLAYARITSMFLDPDTI